MSRAAQAPVAQPTHRSRRRRGRVARRRCAPRRLGLGVGLRTPGSQAGQGVGLGPRQAPARRAPRGTRPGPRQWPHVLRRSRHQAGQDQARLSHHPGEQVLRRVVHRAQQQHLPVEDPPLAGGAAQELLRHGSLLPGQLPVDDLRPGAGDRHPGRLPVLQRDERVGRLQREPRLQPRLRPVHLRRRPQRSGRPERMRVSQLGADPLQPARLVRGELEGLRPGPRQSRRLAPDP